MHILFSYAHSLVCSPSYSSYPDQLHSSPFPTYSLGVHLPLLAPSYSHRPSFPRHLSVRPSLSHCSLAGASATAHCQPFSLSTPSPWDQSRWMRPLNWAPLAQAEGLSRRARQLTQDEAEQNKPRARNWGEAEAHHDSKEQLAVATRVATPQKELRGRRERTPPTTALQKPRLGASAWVIRLGAGLFLLSSQSSRFKAARGVVIVGAGGWGDHALAFWFTVTLTLLRVMLGRFYPRIKGEDELLRGGCR